MPYKLRSVIRGHELDVRAVSAASFPENAILSASRDRTCKLWSQPNDSTDQNFVERNIFTGHSKYVAAVCQLPPTDKYPTVKPVYNGQLQEIGLVATGGHDNLILLFSLDSHESVTKLEGHTGAVCSLKCGNYGTLVSGSWDKTARVWINGKCAMTLSGHDAAVWCVGVIPEQGLMLTASADKTIKLWKAGKCERTFTGHTDCVRSIAVTAKEEFLSCGNDGSVRRWHINGECLAVHAGHNSFIYSISNLFGDVGHYVTSGEDRSIKIWKDGSCEQTITLPCQSVWSVACLPNGDIVAGASDGIVRVFTASDDRVASADVIKLFEEEVANQAIPAAASLDLGDIKIDQLPGPEALMTEGSGDGKPKLIKRNGVVEAYQWDTIDKKWQKIGDVVGKAGAEGSTRQGNKTMYQGKEYDFVFDVDIEEGKPPLKLPFDLTEDPYTAANKFLGKNDLSPMFLDQVARFIIDNTKGFELGGPPPSFSDPFTGGSRYVPGGSTTNQQQMTAPSATRGADPFTGSGCYIPGSSTTNQQQMTAPSSTQGADPFTGGSCYISGSQNQSQVTNGQSSQNRLFPQTNYLYFEVGKSAPISAKLKEFNDSVSNVSTANPYTEQKISPDELKIFSDAICQCTSASFDNIQSHDQIISILNKLSSWPQEKLLPVLDSLRLLIRSKQINRILLSNDGLIVSQLLSLASANDAPSNNQMLVFRVLANSFSINSEETLSRQRLEILDLACKLFQSDGGKTKSIAISTVLLNYAILLRKSTFDDKISMATAVMECLLQSNEAEPAFRLMMALGTLIDNDKDMISFTKSYGISEKLPSLKSSDQEKVSRCASELLGLIA